MANSLDALSGWLGKADWPRVSCPTCQHGSVGFDGAESYVDPKSRAILEEERRYGGPQEELTGVFAGSLKCDNFQCGQTLAMSGQWGYFVNEGDPKYGQMVDVYQLEHVTPALRLLIVPPNAPQDVKDAVTTASALLWASPSAAANQLRQGIEALLTAKRVRRFSVNKGRRTRLTTHARIELYRPQRPLVGDALMAVKWIGNSGSHDGELTLADVLMGASILELALKDLYDQQDKALMAKVQAINTRRRI